MKNIKVWKIFACFGLAIICMAFTGWANAGNVFYSNLIVKRALTHHFSVQGVQTEDFFSSEPRGAWCLNKNKKPHLGKDIFMSIYDTNDVPGEYLRGLNYGAIAHAIDLGMANAIPADVIQGVVWKITGEYISLTKEGQLLYEEAMRIKGDVPKGRFLVLSSGDDFQPLIVEISPPIKEKEVIVIPEDISSPDFVVFNDYSASETQYYVAPEYIVGDFKIFYAPYYYVGGGSRRMYPSRFVNHPPIFPVDENGFLPPEVVEEIIHSGGGIYPPSENGGGSAPVPEPATILLFGVGLVGLVGVASKKKK